VHGKFSSCFLLGIGDLDGVDGYGAEEVGEGELGSRDTWRSVQDLKINKNHIGNRRGRAVRLSVQSLSGNNVYHHSPDKVSQCAGAVHQD
jgi:hypothetical protein